VAPAAYERAVECDPDCDEGHNNLGRLYVDRGDLDMAIRMYEKALEIDPLPVIALRNPAVIYRHGRGDEVQATYYEVWAEKIAGKAC
jgi:tetratricopeptide (TPR) repeat protein